MKILMVSMPSLHFFRWTEQLQDAGHEIHWFNITDSGEPVSRLSWVKQYYGWRLKWDFPGRTWLKTHWPQFSDHIETYNTHSTETAFQKVLQEVQPDVVHSFALYVSCSPILSILNKHSELNWIYSSWGSDLFYFQNQPDYLKDIKKVLPRIDYLFTDCERDYNIAKSHGFKGKFLGVFPGGGGFKFKTHDKPIAPYERQIILIKGFQGRSGRALIVLKALMELREQLKNFKVIVFGCDKEVVSFIKDHQLNQWENFEYLGRIKHNKVLELMSRALIYIGNSNSDGIPNTMLEAICYGAFPIQSNPGKATQEVITHSKNGLLIDNCNDVEEIKSHLQKSLQKDILLQQAFDINIKMRKQFEYQYIKEQVLDIYNTLN